MFFLLFACSIAAANSVEIPQISVPIKISDFAGMRPRPDLESKLAKVEGFLQSNPNDGAPATQKTIVYLAYDHENIYIVFLCFDSEPQKISTSMTRRERFSDDEDWVEVYFDTYFKSIRFPSRSLDERCESVLSEVLISRKILK
jgi:hypothetical protein